MTFSTRGHMKLPPAASWKTMLYLPRQDLRLPICNGSSRDRKLFRRSYWPVDQERARPTMTLPPPSLLFSLTKNTFSLFFTQNLIVHLKFDKIKQYFVWNCSFDR
uniref:(northern house mosquito) hypothetical protein n=1 Tax=Culex pipiens TaxID=7175 RepID=A0A8D8FIS3_CULPI